MLWVVKLQLRIPICMSPLLSPLNKENVYIHYAVYFSAVLLQTLLFTIYMLLVQNTSSAT